MIELIAEPLTVEIFATFGEIIDLRQARTQSINFGLTTRFHDLATVDTHREGGRTLINIFRSEPIPLPHQVLVMERHPLGSQAFIPMTPTRFLVLVGEGKNTLNEASLRLFITDGVQGVNFHANTWHHYQMVLDHAADFVVIDRGGPDDNLDEVVLESKIIIPSRL